MLNLVSESNLRRVFLLLSFIKRMLFYENTNCAFSVFEGFCAALNAFLLRSLQNLNSKSCILQASLTSRPHIVSGTNTSPIPPGPHPKDAHSSGFFLLNSQHSGSPIKFMFFAARPFCDQNIFFLINLISLDNILHIPFLILMASTIWDLQNADI